MLKQLTLAAAIASALTASLVQAETVSTAAGDFDVSMNASLTTNYVWRGVSQTRNNGAIQGGLDVAHDSGLYVGVWGSNVDFDSEASVEFDYYAGFGGNITDDVSYDLGYNTYTYPDQSSLDFAEYYGSVSAYGFTLGANYSNDFTGFGGSDATLYTYVGYEYSLPMDIGLALQYGNYDFKDDLSVGGDDSYNDWSVGLTKELAGLEFGLTYTDTNLSGADQAFFGKNDFSDANVTLSVSKSL